MHWRKGLALSGVLLGGVFFLIWQQETLATASSILAGYLHELAFFAHTLFSKILVGVQEILAKE